MRELVYTNSFKRDYKGMLLGLHSNLFPTNLKATTASMAYDLGLALSDSLRSPTKSAGRADHRLSDEDLPDNLRDHSLIGHWVDYRECHLKPDLLLIYRKPDDELLQLVRLGSHSKLGL